MKNWKSGSRLISYEYMKASQKLDSTQRFNQTKRVISIRSVTPEGLGNKADGRKHQTSFSYVPKTKTPGVQPKAKPGHTYRYFKSIKANKSTDAVEKQDLSIATKKEDEPKAASNIYTGIKFSSRNSKQNTNSDTLWSVRSNKSKKGSNVNSITSERDKSYYEKWKQVRAENKKLVDLLEENNLHVSYKLKEYRKETELWSELLLEILPIIKHSVQLDNCDFLSINKIGDSSCQQQKQKLLHKI